MKELWIPSMLLQLRITGFKRVTECWFLIFTVLDISSRLSFACSFRRCIGWLWSLTHLEDDLWFCTRLPNRHFNETLMHQCVWWLEVTIHYRARPATPSCRSTLLRRLQLLYMCFTPTGKPESAPVSCRQCNWKMWSLQMLWRGKQTIHHFFVYPARPRLILDHCIDMQLASFWHCSSSASQALGELCLRDKSLILIFISEILVRGSYLFFLLVFVNNFSESLCEYPH